MHYYFLTTFYVHDFPRYSNLLHKLWYYSSVTVICEHFSNPATVRITGNNSEFQRAKINDKNTIRLPRQGINRWLQNLWYQGFWYKCYLIYNPFTTFCKGRNLRRKPIEKENRKDIIKILFVCWDITLTDTWNLDVSDAFSENSNYLQLIYNIWNCHDMMKIEYGGCLSLSSIDYKNTNPLGSVKKIYVTV